MNPEHSSGGAGIIQAVGTFTTVAQCVMHISSLQQVWAQHLAVAVAQKPCCWRHRCIPGGDPEGWQRRGPQSWQHALRPAPTQPCWPLPFCHQARLSGCCRHLSFQTSAARLRLSEHLRSTPARLPSLTPDPLQHWRLQQHLDLETAAPQTHAQFEPNGQLQHRPCVACNARAQQQFCGAAHPAMSREPQGQQACQLQRYL